MPFKTDIHKNIYITTNFRFDALMKRLDETTNCLERNLKIKIDFLLFSN